MTRIFGSFSNWDGVFFQEVAEQGYSWEKIHAFFPLLPLLIRFIAFFLSPFFCGSAARLLAGYLITNSAFICSVVVMDSLLSRLSDVAHFSVQTRRLAILLYTFTPSSIFMSSVYTEAPFALFSLVGMKCYVDLLQTCRGGAEATCGRGGKLSKLFLLTLSLSLASGLRSNGAVAAVFPAHLAFVSIFSLSRRQAILNTLFFSLVVLCIVAPSFLFQYYAYTLHCPEGASSAARICGGSTVSASLPPFLGVYSTIQREYWGIGWFKYYELKQIPNFLLALPVISASFVGIKSLLLSISTTSTGSANREERERQKRSGGVYSSEPEAIPLRSVSLLHGGSPYVRRRQRSFVERDDGGDDDTVTNSDVTSMNTTRYLSPCALSVLCHPLLPFLIHWMVHVAATLTVLMVQVSTRFMGSLPFLYIQLALFARPQHKSSPSSRWREKAVLLWVSVFFSVGTTLFSLFLPWT